MNLLIIDDDPTSLKLLRAQLEAHGHTVFEAHDGVDALALLERQRVDAVISDILMPRMDGYRLCYEIRRHARLHDLPVILYTSSYTSPSDEKLALDVGADKYLKKPASGETLVAALHEVIAQPRAAPRAEALGEVEVLKEYSERLVNKLEEKNTELMAAEAKFRALVEQSIVGIYIIQDHQFVYVNPRMAEVLGRSEEEMTSLTIDDIIVPEDHALFRENIRQRISGEVSGIHYYLRMLHQSGAVLQVEVHGSQTEYNGRPAVMGMLVDITERKRAEESLRLQSAALNAAANAIVITDRAGAIEWINPAFTEITGYSTEEALGKNHRDLVNSGKQDRAFFKQLWDAILAGRRWHSEIINRRKDGRLYTEDQVVTPILNAAGVITHFVAIQQDITERLQLEAQFRQAQKMESVGQLASGIAHDFNNLLTVINGMSELVLTEVSPDDPVHADVLEIKNAGKRAATLTRQLLAFSRQQILEPRVLNLSTVVAGMESLLRRLIGEDIDLVVVPTPDAGHVKADPGQLEQVITNLAVNARDAMPQGGKLTIDVQNITIDEASAHPNGEAVPAGPYVRLAVGDSGIGMDEATRARIFEPFFTTKGPGKGTGLGLSTVFGIIKQSHGFVWVDSEVGQGSSFKIYLPQVTEAAGTERPAPTVVSSSATETILLVEDNAGLRKLATRFLEPVGYTALLASTGEEALQLLERHEGPVHLLLSDVVMPGMSGRQLAERLAQTRPGMKVLYMSGYTSDTILRHGISDAQIPFLNKPFTAAALLQKVREVLDS